MSETTALAPRQSVADFLREIGRIARESERTRPSRFRPVLLSRWSQERTSKIAEIVSRYKGSGENVLSLASVEIPLVHGEVVEEVSNCLIKSTCVEEEKKKRAFASTFENIFRYESGHSAIDLVFLIKKGERLTFSQFYRVNFSDLVIVIDVQDGESMWFRGSMRGGNTYETDKFELHVHSKNDIPFLAAK